MSNIYKRIDIVDGETEEPVNFVGVHPLSWEKRTTIKSPAAGFVEINEDNPNVIEKKATKVGTGSHIVTPRDWLGDRVICIRIPEDE